MKKKYKLESLIEILENSKINSLEVSTFWGYKKIKLSKNSNVESLSVASQSENRINSDNTIPKEITEPISEPISSNQFIQKAPLVGTVYLSPKPGEPNFVKVGDHVKKGQKLCLIEAMKIFNEIESEYDGVIQEILVRDEDPVEFGQPILIIR